MLFSQVTVIAMVGVVMRETAVMAVAQIVTEIRKLMVMNAHRMITTA